MMEWVRTLFRAGRREPSVYRPRPWVDPPPPPPKPRGVPVLEFVRALAQPYAQHGISVRSGDDGSVMLVHTLGGGEVISVRLPDDYPDKTAVRVREFCEAARALR